MKNHLRPLPHITLWCAILRETLAYRVGVPIKPWRRPSLPKEIPEI